MRFEHNGYDLYFDDRLATQLHTIAYNLATDWEVVIVISGDRTVRVGKCVLGLTVSAYMSHALKTFNIESPFTADSVYFDSTKMLKEAIKLPKHSIIQYDEGRESLAASKHMMKLQQDILDFFAECGQLNHVFIVVLPDFFSLKEEIAVPRAEFLLNVYRVNTPKEVTTTTGEKKIIVNWERGQFQFFSRSRKAQLHDNSRRKNTKWYNPKIANFVGRFSNQYPIDEKQYKDLKLDALKRFRKESGGKGDDMAFRNAFIMKQYYDGKKPAEIVKLLKEEYNTELSKSYMYEVIQKSKKNPDNADSDI